MYMMHPIADSVEVYYVGVVNDLHTKDPRPICFQYTLDGEAYYSFKEVKKANAPYFFDWPRECTEAKNICL